MVEALERFQDSVKDNAEAALFSFVGHATEVNGNLFLIPAGLKQKDAANLKSNDDLERHLRMYALPFREVQTILRQVRKGQKPTVFVLDCCRSNGFYSTRAAVEETVAAPSLDLINSYIIFSTQSGQVAFDGDPGRGGPFMSAFADSIILPNTSLEDIMIETRKRVIQNTNEVQMAPVYNALTEKFIFNPVEGSLSVVSNGNKSNSAALRSSCGACPGVGDTCVDVSWVGAMLISVSRAHVCLVCV
eukprot:323848-Hanusia_phi.AAC.2